jgi:hypothetical protein
MAVRIKEATREYLCSVALPVFEDSYTVISHESVMDYTLAQLTQFGFNVKSESFRCTADGNIAQGTYYLNYDGDEEIGMMFAWSNSYNKQVRFKCAIGGYVFVCLNGMICGDMGSWGRKHTGTADVEAQKTIADQISNAQVYYDRLVTDKNIMKEVVIDTKRQAELLGVLFAEYEILTTEQMSLVKQQMDKPSFFYNGDVNSLWSFYNHVTLALKKSHPRNWMEDQRKLHWFLSMEFDLENFQTIEIEDEAIDPLALNYGQPENQTNILHQLADMEADQIDEDIRYDANVTEELATQLHLAETTFMNARALELKLELEADTFAMAQLAGVKAPEEFINALMNAPEIDASEVDMSKVTWFDAPDIIQYTDPVGNTFETVSFETSGEVIEKEVLPIPSLAPTPEEFLIIEAEINQEIIEEEALFDVSKMEIIKDNDFDFDLSLDDDEVKPTTDGYFL